MMGPGRLIVRTLLAVPQITTTLALDLVDRAIRILNIRHISAGYPAGIGVNSEAVTGDAHDRQEREDRGVQHAWGGAEAERPVDEDEDRREIDVRDCGCDDADVERKPAPSRHFDLVPESDRNDGGRRHRRNGELRRRWGNSNLGFLL